jgi:hypothetical protein
MKSIPQKVVVPKFLSGWKEIANYLGKGVRTVQRYERELGFPARRPAGKSHAAVIATKAEVDAWVAASPIREQFRLSRPQTDSPGISLDDLKQKVATMGMLRDEMAALRTELRASVQGLAESIQGIHGEIDNRWGVRADHRFLELGVTRRRTSDESAEELLTKNTTRRKAS